MGRRYASVHGAGAFPKLTGAPYKRYIEIGEGTHTLIMEKNRLALFEAVQQFFDERYRAE